jgi:hypothetical protein
LDPPNFLGWVPPDFLSSGPPDFLGWGPPAAPCLALKEWSADVEIYRVC